MENPEFSEAIDAVHHERFIRIICIGAGASGLCFAYKLQRSFRNFSLSVCAPDLGPFHSARVHEDFPLTIYTRYTKRMLESLELGMRIHIQG